MKNNKTFNWENYNQTHKSHSMLEMTKQEIIDWARNWNFIVIEKTNGDLRILGNKNKMEIDVKIENFKVKSLFFR